MKLLAFYILCPLAVIGAICIVAITALSTDGEFRSGLASASVAIILTALLVFSFVLLAP